MNFEWLNSNKDKNEKKIRVLLNFAEVRCRFYFKKFKEEYPEESRQEIYTRTIAKVLKKLKERVPEKLEMVDDLAKKILSGQYVDQEDFISSASRQIADFLVANFSFQELEEISRRSDNLNINRLISYEIVGEVIRIHTPMTFVDNPLELRSLFIDALKKLAEKLRNDPDLANITKIKADSWIIFRAHKALKSVGFTITNLDEDKQVGSAEVSKEKLIELYG